MTTQTIPIELTRPGPLPVVYATAGDIYSRRIALQLYSSGTPYTPPEGTTCLIGWRRPDGVAGNYDTITESDGESTHNAWQLEGSTLTIELADKVCAQTGDTAVNVALIGTDGSRLHTWELVCRVERGAVADSDHGYQPSETATEAADRAEKAAQAAEATLGQVQTSISKATEAATQEAKAAAQQAEDALGQVQSRIDQATTEATRAAEQAATQAQTEAGNAEASAGRAEAAAEKLEETLKTGPVVSVNGKTGTVTLTAKDLQALPLPDAPQAGQVLVVKEVAEDGSVTLETKASVGGGFVLMEDEEIPPEERTEHTLYFQVTDKHDSGVTA